MKPRPNNLLIKLFKNNELTGGNALDIGAGAGNDSLFLAENNYSVTALEPKVEKLVENTKGARNVSIVEENMTDFDYPESTYDLVIANNSLPFIKKEALPTLIEKIITSLHTNGYFCFTLFGLEDEWSDKENMNFISYEDSISLLHTFPVTIYFQSTEKGYGTTMKGDVKFWEIHRFIVKKSK